MPKALLTSRSLSTHLPDNLVENGCFALTEGFGEHAAPFPLESLFGTNALLGPLVPQSHQEDAFFDTPAPVYLCNEVTTTFSVAHALAQKGLLPACGVLCWLRAVTEGRDSFADAGSHHAAIFTSLSACRMLRYSIPAPPHLSQVPF